MAAGRLSGLHTALLCLDRDITPDEPRRLGDLPAGPATGSWPDCLPTGRPGPASPLLRSGCNRRGLYWPRRRGSKILDSALRITLTCITLTVPAASTR